MRAKRMRGTIGLLLAAAVWTLVGCGEKAAQPPVKTGDKSAGGVAPTAAPLTAQPPAGTIRFKVAEKSPRSVGRFAPETGSAKSAKGEAGALHFGPYTPLNPGTYRATFRIRGEGKPGATVGKVDVNVFDETKPETTLGAAPVTADAGGRLNDVSVDFDGKGEVRHEFRVFVNGEGAVELLEVWVTPR